MSASARRGWIIAAAAWLAPAGTAALLLPLRDRIDNTNIALLLTIPVVAVGVLGRRRAVLIAALSAATAFDFFHTLPYYHLTIRSGDDLLTAGLLLAVGVMSGELAVRARRHRAMTRSHGRDIVRIHAVVEQVASGVPAQFVVVSVASELRLVLGLRDVRFERSPVTHETELLPDLDQYIVDHKRVPDADDPALPAIVTLRVIGARREWGRYVLSATPGLAVPLAQCLIAITLARQVGVAMAAAEAARQ